MELGLSVPCWETVVLSDRPTKLTNEDQAVPTSGASSRKNTVSKDVSCWQLRFISHHFVRQIYNEMLEFLNKFVEVTFTGHNELF